MKQGHLFSEAFVLACSFIWRGVEWKTNLEDFLPLQKCIYGLWGIWDDPETNLKFSLRNSFDGLSGLTSIRVQFMAVRMLVPQEIFDK